LARVVVGVRVNLNRGADQKARDGQSLEKKWSRNRRCAVKRNSLKNGAVPGPEGDGAGNLMKKETSWGKNRGNPVRETEGEQEPNIMEQKSRGGCFSTRHAARLNGNFCWESQRQTKKKDGVYKEGISPQN